MYLIIVRKDEESQRWVVDQDSEHILVDDGGNYPIQELQVHTIRALVPALRDEPNPDPSSSGETTCVGTTQ